METPISRAQEILKLEACRAERAIARLRILAAALFTALDLLMYYSGNTAMGMRYPAVLPGLCALYLLGSLGAWRALRRPELPGWGKYALISFDYAFIGIYGVAA